MCAFFSAEYLQGTSIINLFLAYHELQSIESSHLMQLFLAHETEAQDREHSQEVEVSHLYLNSVI